MPDNQSLNDIKLLAALTFKEKLLQTVGLFKNHGVVILLTNFVVIAVALALMAGLSLALIPFEQLSCLLELNLAGHEIQGSEIKREIVISALWLLGIFFIVVIFATIPSIGFYSLILIYMRGGKPEQIVKVILNPFTRLRGLIVPVLSLNILMLATIFMVPTAIIDSTSMFEYAIFTVILEFIMTAYSCYFVFLADGKHSTIWKDMGSVLKLIFSDLYNWGLLMLIFACSTLITDVVDWVTPDYPDQFGVEIWGMLATIIFYLWHIAYFFVIICFLSCLTVITYRQSRARLFLKGLEELDKYQCNRSKCPNCPHGDFKA